MRAEAMSALPPTMPARLDIRQTAMLLGVQEEEIQILMRAKLLKPLGEPAQNGHKYFSSSEIEALGKDRVWLDKASKTITRHWRSKRGTLEATREKARVATLRDDTAADLTNERRNRHNRP